MFSIEPLIGSKQAVSVKMQPIVCVFLSSLLKKNNHLKNGEYLGNFEWVDFAWVLWFVQTADLILTGTSSVYRLRILLQYLM